MHFWLKISSSGFLETMSRMVRGALIIFEGVDRSGKSTQIKRIFEKIKNRGDPVYLTRFPERTSEIGKMIRGQQSEIRISFSIVVCHFQLVLIYFRLNSFLKIKAEVGMFIL